MCLNSSLNLDGAKYEERQERPWISLFIIISHCCQPKGLASFSIYYGLRGESRTIWIPGLEQLFPAIYATKKHRCFEISRTHKVLTYIEYRAVSGVFRTINPPPPLHPASVSSPRTKGEGVHTRWAVRGWRVNISEDARHWIGLLQYNPV
jgi:hypothetical protein